MSDVTYEQVVQLVDQLNPEDRLRLIQHIQGQTTLTSHQRITREMLITELEQLRAEGAFEKVDSLRNRYASPALNISDDELRAGIRAFSR
jgi:hypothetical protein